MKRNWMLTILAAAVASCVTYGEAMEGKIPFDFTIGTTAMPSGKYEVKRVYGAGITYTLQIRNVETKETLLVVSPFGIDRNATATADGSMVFRCAGRCALAEVHTPGESKGRAVSVPRTKPGETERRVAIRLGASDASSGF